MSPFLRDLSRTLQTEDAKKVALLDGYLRVCGIFGSVCVVQPDDQPVCDFMICTEHARFLIIGSVTEM
jgi:hypothetical protein